MSYEWSIPLCEVRKATSYGPRVCKDGGCDDWCCDGRGKQKKMEVREVSGIRGLVPRGPRFIRDGRRGKRSMRSLGVMGHPIIGGSTTTLMAKGTICAGSLTPSSYLVIGIMEDPCTRTLVGSVGATHTRTMPKVRYILACGSYPGGEFAVTNRACPRPDPCSHLVLSREVHFIKSTTTVMTKASRRTIGGTVGLIGVRCRILRPMLSFHATGSGPVLIRPRSG